MVKLRHAKSASEINSQLNKVNPEKSSLDWMGTIFKFSAILLVCIYVYGYGAVVGYASYFGLPLSAVYSSTSDLLSISYETLFYQILNNFSIQHLTKTFVYLFKENAVNFALTGILIAVIWFSITQFSKINKQKNINREFKLIPEDNILLSENTKKTLMRSSLYGIAGSVLLVAIQFSFIIFAFLISTLFLLTGMTGYSAALQHVEHHIIRPINCDPIHTRLSLIKHFDKQKNKKVETVYLEPTANCIKVTYSDSQGRKIIAGRSIFAGSEHILIYETTGKVTRIPIKNAIIESADDSILEEVAKLNAKKISEKN